MKFGCTQAYTASGTISGGDVSLALSGAQTSVCAASQTLSGTVDPSGTALLLVLSNAYQTSPAGRFTGTATRLGPETRSEAKLYSFPVTVTCTGRKQLCSRAFAVSVDVPKGPLVVQFTTKGHCSDVRFFFSVAGGPEKVSPFVHLNGRTPAYTFAAAPGRHRIQVRAEGRRGGCNKGFLLQWAGTLQVRAG